MKFFQPLFLSALFLVLGTFLFSCDKNAPLVDEVNSDNILNRQLIIKTHHWDGTRSKPDSLLPDIQVRAFKELWKAEMNHGWIKTGETDSFGSVHFHYLPNGMVYLRAQSDQFPFQIDSINLNANSLISFLDFYWY